MAEAPTPAHAENRADGRAQARHAASAVDATSPAAEQDGGAGAPARHAGPARTPYVRPRTPHRTVAPVDDLAQDDALAEAEVTHESNFTVGARNPLSGRGYRRSRSDMARLNRDLQYGQYLSIPKGRRAIFASRERKRKIKSIVALVVLVAMLAIVAVVVWQLMSSVGQ